MSTTAQIKDSMRVGNEVLARMGKIGKLHRGQVEQASFAVLKAPSIPSILVETAFISNTGDERRLRDTSHQQRIAEAIRAGVHNYWYENPPPGTRLASIVAARREAKLGTSPTETLAGR